MRLMSKTEYPIMPKGTKFTGPDELWLRAIQVYNVYTRMNRGVQNVPE